MKAELILRLANLDKQTVYAIVDYLFTLNNQTNKRDEIESIECQAREEIIANLLKLIGDEGLPF